MLDYRRQDQEDITVLSLKGHLDALTAPALKKEIESLVRDQRTQVVFDLVALDLIDSSGVGAIVSLFKRVRSLKGDVKISGLAGQPKEIFRLLRLDRAFDIYAGLEEAMRGFE